MTEKIRLDSKVFTTEIVAKALILPQWRVVRFAQVNDYGIRPYYGVAAGPGSRRLYNLENVCEIALASWLTQAGLQVKVVGNVLTQLRRQGGLTHFVSGSTEHLKTYLGVIRARKHNKISQDAVYLRNWAHLEDIFKRESASVLVLDIGVEFFALERRLEVLVGD